MNGQRVVRHRRGRLLSSCVLAVPLAWGAAEVRAAEATPATAPAAAPFVNPSPLLSSTDRAMLALNTARQAYNDGQVALATEQFREALKQGLARQDMATARYGLGLCLLEGPAPVDFQAAAESLAYPAQVADFVDRPYALYHLALAYRGQGEAAAAAAAGKSKEEAEKLRGQADSYFRYAASNFAAATAAFERVAPPATDAQAAQGGQLPAIQEWRARSRCDQAEMLLRLGMAKPAAAATEPFTAGDELSRSRYRALGLYYHGHAQFLLREYAAAGRALAQLAPFDQPAFGGHARYLLARVHHLTGELPEAEAAYEAVAAALAGSKPQDLPAYAGPASLYRGTLLAEQGKHEAAAARLAEALAQLPAGSPAALEAQLRLGAARVEMKAFAEALPALEPLRSDPAWSDQALRWAAKAKLGLAEAAKADAERSRLVGEAVEALRASAEQARAKAGNGDPAARSRYARTLLELGEALGLAGQHKESAAAYARLAGSSSAAGPLAEQALARQAVALQLAGQHAASDEACARFVAAYPGSALAGEVMVRHGENALLAAAAAATLDQSGAEAKRLYAEAAARFARALAKTPEGPLAVLARQGLATAHYQAGRYDEALKVIEQVPEAERTGELATLSYLQADCLMRTIPEVAGDDAIETARAMQRIEQAIGMLNAYAIAKENKPESVDALVKLGYCHQRLADLLVDPVEKRKNLALARRLYRQALPLAPGHAVLVLEHAKLSARIGDARSAISELGKFRGDGPLSASPLAPVAMIHLGDAMRLARQAEAAAELLTKVRAEHEAAMLRSPDLAQHVPALQMALGLALKDAGRFVEAQKVFASLAEAFPKRPEAAEAVWRTAQCRRDVAAQGIEAARKQAAGARTAEEAAAARRAMDEAVNRVREAADHLDAQARKLAERLPASEVPLHMRFDAAGCWKVVADAEVEAARRAEAADALAKAQALVANDPVAGEAAVRAAQVLAARPMDVALASVPLQPAEKRLRESYEAILEAAPDSPVALDARLELAEVRFQRDEHAAAVALLKEGLDADPAADVAERIRLQLGSCYLAKEPADAPAALAQFKSVLDNPRSPYVAYARAGAGEAQFLAKDWAGAVETLAPFVEARGLRNLPGIADRALLRLGQSHAQLGKWDEARSALEALSQRFPSSPLVHEARFGLGWARQQLKQHDAAVAAYQEVVQRTGSELGAKAQFQIGLCRMEQGRSEDAAKAFLAAAYGYGYSEWSAAAFCEAARAYVELKRPDEARALLQRVAKEHPEGKWHELATRRLAELK